MKSTPSVTEYLLPLPACPCCGKVNAARPPAGAYPGSICHGPGINTAAVLLSSCGNVPSERAANLIGMLPGIPVSPGFVDLASERLDSRLQDAGFDEAMQAALREEPVLAADETPVNLLDPRAGLAEEDAGAPHLLVVRTPRRGHVLGDGTGPRDADLLEPAAIGSTVLCRCLSAFDPACQIPPAGLIGPSQARPAPYLYSPEEISALIHAAGTLASPLQAATCQALISLLAVTGIRVGEAVALDAGDVDLDTALVTVHGKYDRTRLVPLHPTTVPECAGCAAG